MARRLTVLAGGVGAARFLRGLQRLTDRDRLTVIGNTGDDEVIWGLHVSPDLDTVLYTLAGRSDPVRGWGVAGDSFACLGAMGEIGGATWFRLGDRDLATHLRRSAWLREGQRLSTVTARLARAHGVTATLLPATDDVLRTFVHTAAGRLPFQEYLVRRRARDRVQRIEYTGAQRARPAPGVLAALREAGLILIAPSNPFVSIGPMLAIPAIRHALANRRAPALAISPLVGGRSIKGPLHRMLRSLGHEVSPRGVARLYRGLIDVFVLDRVDAAWAPRIADLGITPVVADTVMRSPAVARRLAAALLRAVDARAR